MKSIIDINNVRNFPKTACEYFLNEGVNHVLVRLRSKKYINDILKKEIKKIHI